MSKPDAAELERLSAAAPAAADLARANADRVKALNEHKNRVFAIEQATKACSAGDRIPQVPHRRMTMSETDYTYMEVHVCALDGSTANEKFFLGRLPNVGEAVEMVYVGDRDTGAMKFQLRVRESSATGE